MDFSFKMLSLAFLREKNSKILPCGSYVSCAVDEIFIEVHLFKETFAVLKNSWLHAR